MIALYVHGLCARILEIISNDSHNNLQFTRGHCSHFQPIDREGNVTFQGDAGIRYQSQYPNLDLSVFFPWYLALGI